MTKSRNVAAKSGPVLVIALTVGLGCSSDRPAAGPQPTKPEAARSANGPRQAVKVKVIRPTRQHLKRTTTPQPAHVAAYEKTEMYAKVSGYLDSFGEVRGSDGKMRPLDIGDRVKKDQALARLSAPEMEQERLHKEALLDQARAEVGQAKASLAAAQALVDAAEARLEQTIANVGRYEADVAYRKGEYERYLTLVKQQAISADIADEQLNRYRAAEAALRAAKAAVATDRANIKAEVAGLAKAKANLTSAEAHVRVAQANLNHAAVLLNYATIKAPYDGVITRRVFDVGAFIQSASAGTPQPLFEIARVDRLRIVTLVEGADAGLVRHGQPAILQLNDYRGPPLAGKVARFADALAPESRSMRTEIELDAAMTLLRPGMFGSVTITVADVPDALLVPASVVVNDGGKPAVFVVEAGKVRRRDVELGLNDGVRVHVIGGLTGSVLVVADHRERLQEGQAVEVDQ